MANKRIFGMVIPGRGSNHRYSELDDLDALYELLKADCVAQVARNLGVPANSIQYRVNKFFPKEWIQSIVKKRNV